MTAPSASSQGDRQTRTRQRRSFCPQQGPHRQPRGAACRACRRVQSARRRAALRPPAGRGLPAGPVQAIDTALTNAHTSIAATSSKGLVQGGRLPDPLRTQQGEPAQRAAEIQRTLNQSVDGIRVFQGEIEALIAKGVVSAPNESVEFLDNVFRTRCSVR